MNYRKKENIIYYRYTRLFGKQNIVLEKRSILKDAIVVMSSDARPREF